MSLTVLVSGASGNLGTAVVKYYLEKGLRVIGIVRRPSTTKPLTENYSEVVLDLLDEKACEKAIVELANHHKHIDIAVLTAGGFAMKPFKDTLLSDLHQQYRLNFETAYNIARPLAQKASPQYKTTLVFIGSEPGQHTGKGKAVVAYSLAKSQLYQLTNIINSDTDKSGIRALVITPTTIDTPQNRQAVPQADFSKWQKPKAIAKIIDKYVQKLQLTHSFIALKDEL